MSSSLGELDDHWEAYEVISDATHRFLWMRHGYNIRVIGVPKNEEQAMGYDWAWCYPRDPALVVHCLRGWIPEVHDEPYGWHKRPTARVRRAPDRQAAPVWNSPRCVHGWCIAYGCRTVGCPDQKEQEGEK